MVWNALIGGGISLLGGLFGRSDAKKRDAAALEASKVPVVTTGNLKEMVAAAEAAGFNPQTVLNAGGLSAFNTVTGQNAMAGVPTAPSMGSVFANAAGNAFNIWREDRANALSSFPPAPTRGGIASVIGATRRSGLAPALTSNNSAPIQLAGTVGGGIGAAATSSRSKTEMPYNPLDYVDPPVTNPEPLGRKSPMGFDRHDPSVPDFGAREERDGEWGSLVDLPWHFWNRERFKLTGVPYETMMRDSPKHMQEELNRIQKFNDDRRKSWQDRLKKDGFNDPFPAWAW